MPRIFSRTALAALASLAAFAAIACGTASANPTISPTDTPVPIVDIHPSLDEPFTLPVNGSAFLDANGYRLTFIRVVQDNHCPAGAQCPAAGAAVVELSVRQSAGAGETRHEMGIGADSPAPDRKIIGAYEIEMSALEPATGGAAVPQQVTLVARRADTRLNITSSATPLEVPLGGVVEFRTDAGGSGIPQYTLLLSDSVVSTLRYDGSAVSETPVEGMAITAYSADPAGASWSLKMDVAGQFRFKVTVNGEIRIGSDGPFVFAYGEEVFTVTVGG